MVYQETMMNETTPFLLSLCQMAVTFVVMGCALALGVFAVVEVGSAIEKYNDQRASKLKHEALLLSLC